MFARLGGVVLIYLSLCVSTSLSKTKQPPRRPPNSVFLPDQEPLFVCFFPFYSSYPNLTIENQSQKTGGVHPTYHPFIHSFSTRSLALAPVFRSPQKKKKGKKKRKEKKRTDLNSLLFSSLSSYIYLSLLLFLLLLPPKIP